MIKNKKAFTLIEVLAIIVVLAIIALIAIPNINGYVTQSKEQAFKTSVESLTRAYQYKSIDDGNLGRVTPCDLDVNKCNVEGYVESSFVPDDEYGIPTDKICFYLTNGSFCSIGCGNSYETKPGNCSSDRPEPSIITDISVTDITVSSAKVFVTFQEEGFVTSLKFRLLDGNNNVIRNWQDATSIDNSSNNKVAKMNYTGLEQGKNYKVEVEIKNNAANNNTAAASTTFSTLGFLAPRITYSTTWEKSKNVTITYTNLEGVINQYRKLTNNRFDITGWQNVSGTTETVVVDNYHYYINAKSSVGGTNQTASAQIGYIDNENDENNTKPSTEILDYKNSSAINTKQVSVKSYDELSGVGYYCISTIDNASNCNGTGNSSDLNKWVLLSSTAEVHTKTVQHQLENDGTYYAFTKDFVGNISNSNPFITYKVHYDLNGGTGNVLDQIKLKGSALTLSDVTPTRSGYEFLGWDTSAATHTAAYAKKGDYTNDSNVTLYAIWRKTITVTYDKNGGTGTVSSSSCYKYNAEANCQIAFRANAFTRTGYTFKGWALGQNGAISYNASQNYNIAESVTVYAGWQANALTFNNQSFTKTFDTASQTISITGASNGNGSYTYSEISEKNAGGTATNYITIASNGTITVSGSTPVGTYTYVVRATSQVSNNVESKTSVTKDATMTITINSYDLSSTGGSGLGLSIASIANQTYKNGAITPEPSVTVKTSSGATVATLVKGTDFTYSYSNNVNVGTATITVTGKGNYSGTKSATFTIVAYDISNATFGSISALTYNRSAQTPTPSVTALSKTLVNNTDFTYSYNNNTNAGTGTVIITGKGNFTGTKSTTFTINPYNLSGATIATIAAVTYNGTQHKPTPAVTALNTTLSSTNDYTYSYGANKNAGTGTVTVTGKGNYTGTKTANFTINTAAAPSNPVVCATNLKYTGGEQGLIATVNLNNGTIKYKVGTKLTASNYLSTGEDDKPKGIDAQNYVVYWYAPADNYAASQGSVTCTIGPKTLNVPGSPSAKNYTGSAQNSGITCPSGSTAGGTTSATNANTYSQTCTLSSTTNYKWNDNTTTAKSISWVINRVTGSTTGSCNTLTYTGSAQTLAAGGSYVSYSNNSGTNATSYTVTVTADGNHTFSDGTTSKTLSCSIARKAVAEPSCTARTYNGSNQVLLAAKTSGEYTNPVMQGTNATSYSVTLTLNSNYQWSSGSNVTSNRTKTCSISPATLTVPSSPAAKNYNGNSQNSGITCPSGSTAGGTTSATSAGTYYHTCTLSNTTNYKWNDNTTTAKSISWVINRVTGSTTGSCNTLTYTGSAQTLASGGSYVSYSNNSGTNATSYTVTVTADGNHKFSDGTTSKTLSCSISPKTLTVPSSPADKNYTGSAQNSGITCPSGSTAGGTTSATAPGTYYQTCTLSSTTNYKWNDNTTTAKSISWVIKQSYKCTEGTLTANSTYGASSGGYVCVKNASSSGGGCSQYSCSGGYRESSTYASCGNISDSGNGYYHLDCSYDPSGGCGSCNQYCYTCTHYICNNPTCITENPVSYYCPSGWNYYSGSDSSMKCYKAATQG